MKEEFDLKGKCIFCQHHSLEGQHYFSCAKPSPEVAVRLSCPMGGEYPTKFSPQALDGVCGNWQKKVY